MKNEINHLYDKLTNKLICNKYILIIYNEIHKL